jgi:hypothetical protein
MNLGAILGIGSVIAIISVVVFAFRQGLKVKPTDGPGPSPYT